MLSLSNMTSASGAAQYAELGDDYYMDAPDIMPENLLPDSVSGDAPILHDMEELPGTVKEEEGPAAPTGGTSGGGQNEPEGEHSDGEPVQHPENKDDTQNRPNAGEEKGIAVGTGKTIYNSMWVGDAAAKMGLSGRVKAEDYKRLLEGITPTGEQLGRVRSGEMQRRPGIDYTFTPPKSVSIMALVAGDERVVKAHMESVMEVMALVEKDATTRVYESGMRVPVQTKNIAAALMTHTTSRAGDPNLHTHSNIINMTLRPDGKWGSLDFTNLWDNSKGRYGEVYSLVLARRLTELGYTVNASGKNAEFEIAGVSERLVRIFSKRREQIKEAMAERGMEGPKDAEQANRMTRDAKSKLPYQELLQKWFHEAGHELDFLQALKEQSLERQRSGIKVDPVVEAHRALDLALEHLSQREATFEIKDILSSARSIGVGKLTERALQEEYNQLIESGKLIPGQRDVTRVTTREMLALEQDNMLRVEMAKNSVHPIGGAEQLAGVQSRYRLLDDHIAALSTILNAEDSLVVLQGNPGVGKTVMMAAGKEVIESRGFRVNGVSASATAAKQLQADSGIESTTLQAYLLENRRFLESNKDRDLAISELKRSPDFSPSVLIVDEGSFVDTLRFNELLQIAGATETRLVLSGDRKQLEAVDAGKPFAQAQDHRAETAALTKILRQKNENIKEAVYDLLERQVRPAFEKSDVREVPRLGRDPATQEQMVSHAVELYFEGDKSQRDNTYLIMTTNKEVQQANSEVHERRKELGEVSTNTVKMTVFKGKGLTNAEMRLAHKYEQNDVVRFNFNDKSQGIKVGSYYVVSRNDIYIEGERQLLLTSQDGKHQLVMSPEKFPDLGGGMVEIFESRRIEVGQGDVLRWRRNDLTRGMVNSEKIVVQGVEDGQLKFLDEAGVERSITQMDYRNRHLDYAYAATTHAVQGGKADKVISCMHSHNRLLSVSLAMVQTSRAVNEHIMVVDDKDAVIARIEDTKYESEAALEMFDMHNRPLNMTTLSDLNELVAMHSIDLKTVYISLLAELNGDRALAQRYIRAVGENPDLIESAILSAKNSEANVNKSDLELKAQEQHLKDITSMLSKGEVSLVEAQERLIEAGCSRETINKNLSHFFAEELMGRAVIAEPEQPVDHQVVRNISRHEIDLDM